MCCRVSTLMCLLFCWNPTPVSFSTISEGFLKLSCRHMRYLLFPPGHLLLVCPPPPLNVPFSYQGHPVVGTQAPWKHLPWNPVYFSQMEGLPWGDPPPPMCAWGSGWRMSPDASKGCHSLSSWWEGEGAWRQAQPDSFACLHDCEPIFWLQTISQLVWKKHFHLNTANLACNMYCCFLC